MMDHSVWRKESLRKALEEARIPETYLGGRVSFELGVGANTVGEGCDPMRPTLFIDAVWSAPTFLERGLRLVFNSTADGWPVRAEDLKNAFGALCLAAEEAIFGKTAQAVWGDRLRRCTREEGTLP
jgi:hypothetical protein